MSFDKSVVKQMFRWLPWLLTAAFVIRSQPFLRLPYDMWHHLMLIRGWFSDGAPFLMIPTPFYHEVTWHWFWAKIFRFLGVSNVFHWAKAIHVIQFAWTIGCLWFFCKTVLETFMPKLEPHRKNLCGLFGAWCFVFGAGTLSMQYQLSWMLWYGVNYQGFTLPAYFLSTALLLKRLVALESTGQMPHRHWQFYAAFLLVAIMMVTHPLEVAYFMIASSFLLIAFADVLWKRMAKHKIIGLFLLAFFLSIPVLINVLHKFGVPIPKSRGLLLLGEPANFLRLMFEEGQRIQGYGMHRGLTTFNELAIISSCILGFLAIHRLYKMRQTRKISVQERIIFWVALSAIFFGLAPRTLLPSGFLALMTVDEQVWRFALASPWFVGPVFFAAILTSQRVTVVRLALVFLPVLLANSVSRLVPGKPFHKTAVSLLRSLELRDEDSVGIQYDRAALARLDEIVLSTPEPTQPGKRNVFLIRADLKAYVRAATGVYVLGDRLGPSYPELIRPLANDFELRIIDIPKDLPVDPDIQTYFPSMRIK